MQEPSGTDIAAEVAEFEQKLERLRVSYEQYFMGIAKREPTVQLKDVVRIMRKLDQTQIRNTALRYRMRTLVQKFNTFRNYWNRTLRAIEAGTYHRDVARVRRKMINRGIEMPKLAEMRTAGEIERALAQAAEAERAEPNKRRSAAEIRGRSADDLRAPRERGIEGESGPGWDDAVDNWEPDFGGTLDEDTQPGAASPFAAAPTGPQRWPQPSVPPPSRPQAPPPLPNDALLGLDDLAGQASAPAARPRPRPAAPPPPPTAAARPAPSVPTGFSREQMDSLYRRFVRAKTMCGEDPKTVHYESLVKTIERQLPKIQEVHQGRGVDFQVVIRNGRAILKAKPK